jgi:hypothetical protein
MPIRPSERARYPKDWPAISRRIRERDGNACKWCLAPNGKQIQRWTADLAKWRLRPEDVYGPCDGWAKPILVVLTVAHLDHTPENCADDNLAALCQRCHLTYDAKHHASTARTTREAASGQMRLLP